MPSVLNVDTIADAAGTGPVALTKQSAAKAWANFEQAASHTVRDSLNISSLNDDGFGLTDTNYISSFGNSDYVAGGHAGRQGASAVTAYWLFPTANGGTIVYSTSSTSWTGGYSPGPSSDLTPYDLYLALCTIHGDLA
jgi:hypothetical protein